MTATAATLDAALKELYKGQQVQNVAYNESSRPFLSMLKKNTGFGGVGYPLPVSYEHTGGRSFTFSTAQSNVVGTKNVQFLIDVVPNYSVAKITNDALLRSRNDKVAFLNGLKYEVNGAIARLSNDIESALFRNGSGAIGVVSGTPTTTATLASADDIVNFSVGQSVVFADTEASALRSATPSVITAVDRDAGTITAATSFATTSSAADGDYIFTEGDYDSASDLNKIRGLDAWLPSSAPGSTAFFSVNRSVDPTRLGGLRYTGSSAAIEESVIGGASRLGRECGAVPDVALMNYSTYRRLINELGSKVQREQGGKAQGGFSGVDVYGPRGLITCKPATFCQDDIIWLLTSNSWELVSMEDPVQIITQDGLRIRAVSNADTWEVRVGSYSQLACNAPGFNCRVSL